MNRIFALVFVMVAGLLPHASAWASAADLQQCEQRVESNFPSREGVRARRAEMLRECTRREFGMQPHIEEYWAYFIYIASEIDAGRMPLAQGNYQITQKKNELMSRGSTAGQQEPSAPPPSYDTRCSTFGGNTNCTTSPSGGRYGDPSGPRFGY